MIRKLLNPPRNAAGESTRLHWLTELIVLGTMISAALVGLFAQDVFTLAVMLAGVAACFVVWRSVHDSVIVAAITTMVFGAVLGWGLNFYDRIWWYDDFAHFAFSLVGAMGVARLILPRFRADTVVLLLGVLWLAWLGIGSLWEIGEWVADRTTGTRHSRGYLDTMMDMILNSAGAAIGVAVYWRWLRRPEDSATFVSSSQGN